MTVEKAAEFSTLLDVTNPADLTGIITVIQTRLIAFAKDKAGAVTDSVSRAKPDEACTHISRAS
jgi:hypothetical protein